MYQFKIQNPNKLLSVRLLFLFTKKSLEYSIHLLLNVKRYKLEN